MEFDDVRVGGQFRVGSAGICPPIKEGDKKINGSMHAEGPVVFGDPGQEKEQHATLIVNRTDNDDKDSLKPKEVKRSVWINGNTRINGDSDTDSALNVTGGKTHAAYFKGGDPDAVYVVGDMYVTGKVDCDNKGRLESRFSSADARPKPFDIKHPSREGYRLRYACVEGPEVGVYHRGRVKNEKVIILPSYWKDFVYTDSISVQLQPIGAHQDVIVKRWDDEKIYLQSRGGMPIDCFYHVYAERNDINPLITEYEGKSCEDYPDPNHHKISEDERNYKDPEYATEQNIRTK